MSALALQRIEGKYEILEKLREGGMGALYKVRHRLLDEIRVIKLMRQQLVDDPELKARFLREAKLAIKLRHPNIAQLYDFTVDDDGTAFIVMEFIDGLTLQDVLAFHGPPPLGFALEIAQQSLKALGYLHLRGLVHRDISPDNLMLTTDSDGDPLIKLIDLGIAKVLVGGQETLKTQTGTFLGKVRYAAPEQFESQAAATADARGDLYSFGIVLYELLTGRFPIQGHDPGSLIAAHMFRPPLPFAESDAKGHVPEALREIVLQALAKKPDDRFDTAAAMSGALDPLRAPDDIDLADLTRLLTRPFVRMQGASSVAPGSTQDRLDESFDPMDLTPAPERLLQAVPTPAPALSREEQVSRHLESARRLAAAEDFEAALSELGSAAELAPENAEVQALCGEVKTALSWQKQEKKRAESLAKAAAAVQRHLDRGDLMGAGQLLEKAMASHGERAPLPELKARLETLLAQAAAAEAGATVRWAQETQRLPAKGAEAETRPETDPFTTRQGAPSPRVEEPATALIRPAPAPVPAAELPAAPSPPPARPGRAGWKLPVAVAAGVLLLVAVVLLLRGRHEETALPAASTPGPTPASTSAAGTLILDALPWAEVVAVVDADGKPQALGSQKHTPLVLSLPPGHYRISFRNPGSRRPVSLDADLAAGAEVRKVAEMRNLSEDEFFRRMGW